MKINGKKRRIILWIAFAIAFIGILQGVSSAIISQYPCVEFGAENVIDYSFSENGGAVVTSTNIFFTNRNYEISNIVTVYDINMPFDYVISIVSDKDGYNILGYNNETDSQEPDTVIVAHSDSNGRNIKTLWSQSKEENELVIQYNFTDLVMQEDKLYVLSHNDKNLFILDCDSFEQQAIPVYSEDDTQVIQNVKFGNSAHEVYIQNRFGGCTRFNTLDSTNEECQELQSILYAAFDDERLTTPFNYSILMWLKTILFFASCIIMAIIVIALLIKSIRNGVLKKIKTVVLVVIGVSAAVIFFTSIFGGIVQSGNSDEAMLTAKRAKYAFEQLSETDFPLPRDIDSMEEFFANTDNRYAINKLVKFLKSFSNPDHTQSVAFATIVLVDENENNYVYIESFGKETSGTVSTYSELLSGVPRNESAHLISVDLADSVYSLAYVPINLERTNNTNYDIYMAVATDELHNTDSLQNTIMFKLYQFIAIVLALYIAFEFIVDCFYKCKEYRNRKKLCDQNAGIALSNIFTFFTQIVECIDNFILVKIIADICSDLSIAELAIMLALPLAANRIGCLIGSALAGGVIEKIGSRKTMLISTALTIGSFGLSAYSCVINNIYLLSIAKFIHGVFMIGMLTTLAVGMPYRVKDEKERERSIASNQSAEYAGIVIAFMLGGAISEYVSHTAMYVIGAVVSIVFLVLAFLIFNRREDGEVSDSENKNNSIKKNPWAAFIKPKTLLFILMIMIPLVLLKGYGDYIFPLFSESKGLSDLTLSSIGVIAYAAAYYGEKVLVLFNNYSKLTSIVIATSIGGIMLTLFIISHGITWAVVTLIAINVLIRVIDGKKILFVAELSANDGFNPLDIQKRFFAIQYGLIIVMTPVLGALTSIGSIFVSATVGISNLLLPRGYQLFIDDNKSEKVKKLRQTLINKISVKRDVYH